LNPGPHGPDPYDLTIEAAERPFVPRVLLGSPLANGGYHATVRETVDTRRHYCE